MPFKVKDLMIDVTSVSPALQCHPTFICQLGCTVAISGCHLGCSYIAFSACHFGCSFYLPSICQAGSITVTLTCPGSLITDTGPILQTIPQLSGLALGNLKEQLKQALEAAEKQQAVEAEALKPQTVADVEMLESKLTGALEELRARKAELQKKK
jgi:hypothetical protein